MAGKREKPERPASRLRRARNDLGRAAPHAATLDGSCVDGNHGHLCDGSGAGPNPVGGTDVGGGVARYSDVYDLTCRRFEPVSHLPRCT